MWEGGREGTSQSRMSYHLLLLLLLQYSQRWMPYRLLLLQYSGLDLLGVVVVMVGVQRVNRLRVLNVGNGKRLMYDLSWWYDVCCYEWSVGSESQVPSDDIPSTHIEARIHSIRTHFSITTAAVND